MNKIRYASFKILSKIEHDRAYSNLLLSSYFNAAALEDRDTAFVKSLVCGVVERLYTLDYNLTLYLKSGVDKLKPQVLTLLRMGAYQLLFMDKVPPFAAINESVEIAKKSGCAFASGLINAVLRKVAEAGLVLPDKSKDEDYYFEIKYSCPKELTRLLRGAYGEENATAVLENSLKRSKLFGRVNSLRTDMQALQSELLKNDIIIKSLDLLNGAFEICSPINLSMCRAFREGLFMVQDLSSQLCCEAIPVKPGESVIDVCAAPGSKSYNLAMKMNNRGKILSFDIHEHKIKLINDGKKRLGIDIIDEGIRDAAVDKELAAVADHVLCDVPCSGFGVIMHKPEIKYKPLSSITELPALQLEILLNSSRLVKKGGTLTYSTCTLNPHENEGVCEKFLEKSGNFEQLTVLEAYGGLRREHKSLTIMPDIYGSDGFFICQFKRINQNDEN